MALSQCDAAALLQRCHAGVATGAVRAHKVAQLWGGMGWIIAIEAVSGEHECVAKHIQMPKGERARLSIGDARRARGSRVSFEL